MSRAFYIALLALLVASLGFSDDRPPPKVNRSYDALVTFHELPAPAKPVAEKTEKEELRGLPESGNPEFVPSDIPAPKVKTLAARPTERIFYSRSDSAKEGKGTGWGWLSDVLTGSVSSNTAATDKDQQNDDSVREEESAAYSGYFAPKAQRNDKAPEVYRPGETTPTISKTPVWSPVETKKESEVLQRWADGRMDGLGDANDTATDAWSSLSIDAEKISGVDPRAVDFAREPVISSPVPELAPRTGYSVGEDVEAVDYGKLPKLSSRGDDPFSSSVFGSGRPPSSGVESPGLSYSSLGSVVGQPSLVGASAVSPALSLPSQAASARPVLNEMGTENQVRPKTLPW